MTKRQTTDTVAADGKGWDRQFRAMPRNAGLEDGYSDSSCWISRFISNEVFGGAVIAS